ncbi:hypothetical protein BIV57_03010 [Mangrovactinospora gilvigrisea]|uniref:AB hydrolase-1 domain-containing protein n=1 Tax=Mangrovactinospora gilvigrisea TaxID=1428644 RepID=A0A1J7BJT8_9ACTN|nr:alpha/beta fold hydrolase [Mangrovactinospora gilvigrisea]OIV38947.1 hypothetical protein BIV57_03010 [Mangrovactinospora gilvigrisea]
MRWGTHAVARTAALAGAITGAGAALLLAGRRVSDLAVRIPGSGGPALTVEDAGPGSITLSGAAADAPGDYALRWGRDGRALVGPPTDILEDGAAVRPVRSVEGDDPLRPGLPVRLSVELHTGDPRSALDLLHRDITVTGETGPLPAWHVLGTRTTWVILAHGLGTTRALALNVLRQIAAFEVPALVVSKRGDPGAPPSPDGLDHLGATEWRDLAAAVRAARARGARRVILYGWSTGATMALRASADPEVRAVLAGLVLDAPILDWRTVLRGRADRRGVPRLLTKLGEWSAEGRAGLPAGPSPSTAPAKAELTVPTLLVQGSADALTGPLATAELAARFPSLATYLPVAGGIHEGAWNAAPERYEETLRRFLTPLV